MKKDRWDDYEAALEKANKTERARIMSRWKKDIQKDFAKVIEKATHPLTLKFLDSNIYAAEAIFLARLK
jgi:hypothetical protein